MYKIQFFVQKKSFQLLALLISVLVIATTNAMEKSKSDIELLLTDDVFDPRLIVLSKDHQKIIIDGYYKYRNFLDENEDKSFESYVNFLYDIAVKANKSVWDKLIKPSGFYGKSNDFYTILFVLSKVDTIQR